MHGEHNDENNGPYGKARIPSGMPPIVRMQVERMEYGIVQQLATYDREVSNAIRLAVKGAIQSFNFRGQIEDEVGILLRQIVREAVDVGARKKIEEMVAPVIEKSIRKMLDE